MANNKQKLELTWIGKDNPEYNIANIEPRILLENSDLSNCGNDPDTENMIIHGDNLLALKALLPEYEGKIKCIYIDPPYNTGNAFEHYDDSVEHSTWLSLMRPRLELLRMLLHTEQGSIWISIDDDETHYLKVLCDEVFGRNNFVANVIWEKKYSPQNDAKWLSDNHDHILVYASNKSSWRPYLLPRTDEMNARYRNPDNDPKGPWKLITLHAKSGVNSKFEYTFSNGVVWSPPPGTYQRFSKDTLKRYDEENKIWFGSNSNAIPSVKNYLSEVKQGVTALTIWKHEDVGHNHEAKREISVLFGENPFDTPKPERLLKRIFDLGSQPGDIVLDSFLGSGTTSAVAHKMGRKHIGIEMFDHVYTHCKVRLDRVIDGHDGLKLSETLNWKGGGAYKFYELAPSFVITDEFGNPVIDGFYNDEKLIKAMCKLMNFTYNPSQTEYWKHGIGQGKNYLYVTTQLLTSGMVQQIAAHLLESESLIICPKKFEPGADKIDSRIIVKKIPQSILKACHFGKKEYLLPIKESTLEEINIEQEEEVE